MPKAKSLYLAKSTEELNKLADINHKPKTIKAAITTADKLYVNAKDAQLNGDEEKAYVLYMRYYYVLKGIWKDSSYKAKKTAYDRQIGLERPGKAIAAAEQLLDSLEARYQMKNNKDDPNARNKKQRMDKPTAVDGGNANGDKEENDEDECLFDSDSSLPEIPDAPSTPVEERKFSAEQIFKNNLEDPLVPFAGGNNSSMTNTQWFGNQSLLNISDAKTANTATAFMPSISVVALYGQLQQKPDDVIVLDCRPSTEQSACHVNYKNFQQWIEIPEETIVSGINSASLSKHMDAGQQKLWSCRADKLIVLVDSESKSVDITGKTSLPVIILKDAIYKFDLSCDLSQEPLLLDGGFLRWHQTYSPYCIGKIARKVSQQQSQAQNELPKQVLPDYPEFPKEVPTVSNDAIDFSATPSKHPIASVDTYTVDNTSHQPANTTLPDVADRYLISNGATVNSHHESLSTDWIAPQPSALLSLGSGPLPADQVVPNININSLSYGDMPNGLPTEYSMHHPVSETYSVRHPGSESYNIPTAASYSVQEASGLPQANVMMSPSNSQLNAAGLAPHPKQDVALPPGSYIPSTPETYGQNAGFSPQQNVSVPMLHPQQDTGLHLSGQNVAAGLGPYSQQGMSTSGSHLQHSMIGPGLHPQQEKVSTAPGNMMEPLPQTQHPAVAPPQHQFAPQATAQNIPPPNQPIVAVSGGGWSHNPRVAYGPIPAPPSYEDAHMMPSHPPVQPPLPPPVSVPLSSSISDPHNAAPVIIPASNPSHTVAGPDHPSWSGIPHEHNHHYIGNASSLQPTEPIMHPRPAAQVVQRPTDAHPPIVQPAGIQMVAPQHHHPQQNQPSHIVHHQFDPAHALRQLHTEREAALERERQERAWMEREKEELRKKREELEAMISRSNASEQQVMEWRQQLVTKENELSTKEMEQQTALQERQKLQKQKEKEISDIVQKLNAEREALERQKQQQQTELIRQQESIEQQKIAAMNEIQREKDAILKQQKELSERQQNMQEQVSKWLQTRGESNNRQLHVETGLPAGWEKKFDSMTGRFYYQDHNTKTTHWNPPSNWLSYNNNSQLKQGIANSSLQPPQQPVSTSNSVPQPPHRAAEGSIMPPPSSIPNTVPSQQPPSSVAMKKPTLPSQPPAVGRKSSTGPPAKTIPDSNKAVAVPDRSTKPQQRAPSHSNAPVKQISPQMWKQKMENLQPVHGGSMGPCLTGMKNFGNTCFMNSIIQCLCSTVPLVVHFFTGKYRYDLNMNNPISTGGRIAEEFNVIARATWYGQYRSITPRDFKNTVAKFAPRFVTSEQQDAQEFLGFVMDGIHEDLNRVRVHHYIENKDSDGVPHSVAAQRAWELHKKRNDSIIVDLFQGQFRSVVTCMICKKQSVTFEAFMYLTVPIPRGGNKPTVEDCIKLFAKPEKMEGANKWFCPNCKCNRDAIKKIEIWKLPPVLLIVLKRFLYHGQWRDKISTYVHYPIHELNMSPYVVGDQQPKNYYLYAITNHTGTLHGGHYTACCRYPYNKNKFYKFDDQEVYEIGTNKLQTAAGYVLFYSSIDFAPPKFGT